MLRQSKSINQIADNAAMVHPVNTGTLNGPGMGDQFRELFQQHYLHDLADFMVKLGQPAGKKNFLVYKNNKYINITTDSIAYFYVKYDTTILVTFDNKEYFVNYSLEEIERLVSDKRFFRVNRQYLVSFNAIKEVEHYFARKLLVNLVIPTKEKLLISKSKSGVFLHWLDDR